MGPQVLVSFVQVCERFVLLGLSSMFFHTQQTVSSFVQLFIVCGFQLLGKASSCSEL